MAVVIDYADCRIGLEMLDDTLWITRYIACRCGAGWEVDISYGIPPKEMKDVCDMLAGKENEHEG